MIRFNEMLQEGTKDQELMNLRKTRSMDVASADMKTINDRGFTQNSLPRTKSEHNLTQSNGVGKCTESKIRAK